MSNNSIHERETVRLQKIQETVIQYFQGLDWSAAGDRDILEETYEKFICRGIWSSLQTVQEREQREADEFRCYVERQYTSNDE